MLRLWHDTHPNQHDYDELATIYAHTDSTSTIGRLLIQNGKLNSEMFDFSNRVADEVTDKSDTWGRLVSQSRNGRSSTYERILSDGSKTETHVFWTEEAVLNCRGCDHRLNY